MRDKNIFERFIGGLKDIWDNQPGCSNPPTNWAGASDEYRARRMAEEKMKQDAANEATYYLLAVLAVPVVAWLLCQLASHI